MLLPWGKGSCRAATTGAHMAALYAKGELRPLTHFGSLHYFDIWLRRCLLNKKKDSVWKVLFSLFCFFLPQLHPCRVGFFCLSGRAKPKQHPLVPSRVKFYLERFSPTTKGKLNNSFIEFLFENENKIGKILFIDKEAGHLAVAELSKKRLTIDLRDSFFRVEETNRAFQVAFDDISHVFGSVSVHDKLFLFRINN